MAGNPLREVNIRLAASNWVRHRKGLDQATGYYKYTFHQIFEGDRESPARRHCKGLHKVWETVRRIEESRER